MRNETTINTKTFVGAPQKILEDCGDGYRIDYAGCCEECDGYRIDYVGCCPWNFPFNFNLTVIGIGN